MSNTILQESDSLLGLPSVVLLILGGLYGPFCEELVCRGVYFNGYEKYTGPMRAALISALLFALAHLNLNQAAYAFVLGFIFVVLNKAAGSIYPSVIVHTCINGSNILAIILAAKFSGTVGNETDITAAAEAARNSDIIYVLIGVSLVLAMICMAVAIPCIVWISKHEGRFEGLYDMFANRHPGRGGLTVSFVLAMIFVLFIMFGLVPVMSLIKGA